MGSVVYLAENEDQTIMKVGTTANIKQRGARLGHAALASLHIDAGRFRIIMSLPGGYAKESSVLRRLASLRLSGPYQRQEWFRYSSEISTLFKGLGASEYKGEFYGVAYSHSNGRPPIMLPCPFCRRQYPKTELYREHLARCSKNPGKK